MSEHIRGRLVGCILDIELSRLLQVISDLTLETAVQMVQQAEDVTQQMSQQAQQVAFRVQPSKRGGRQPAKKRSDRRERAHSGVYRKKKPRAKCPAFKPECRKMCQKGKWERKCLSKSAKKKSVPVKRLRKTYI